MPYKRQDQHREYQRTWISAKRENDPHFCSRVRERNKGSGNVRLAFVDGLKARMCCLFCAESDPANLDFHHINPKTKVAGVSAMARQRYSMAKIQVETMKCICVCKTHHSDLTTLLKQYTALNQSKRGRREINSNLDIRRQIVEVDRFIAANHPNFRFKGNPVKAIMCALELGRI